MSGVTDREKQAIREQVERGDGEKMLPFPFMGWVECTADTAYDWQFSGLLNNVHTEKDGDFSQAEKISLILLDLNLPDIHGMDISHTGALLVGTYDNFTDGAPSDFLRNLNARLPAAGNGKTLSAFPCDG